MKKLPKILCALTAAATIVCTALPLSACAKGQNELVLRVSNWEEYIDLGDWDDGELIDIDNPYDPEAGGVIGVNSMVDDFTAWFNSTHDYTVRVEYSTFGTNEDLYNRLNLGDAYDLVCPSDHMIMQLMREDRLTKYSDGFYDTGVETNYYANNVSTFITDNLGNIPSVGNLNEYAAGYMWGTTGIVYNPEKVEADDVKSWNILRDKKYARQVTVKDNVRDSYFPALGILNSDALLEGTGDPDELLNATDDETIEKALEILKEIKENVYSFETDSGKADMITGKVLTNYQWSGDAVFIMDEADDDDNHTELWYSVPDECTNLWFDGWVMLKDGIGGNERKREAAEAFVNFLSRPDNAIRNMYYIGYTSAIAGDVVHDYLDWNYDASEIYDESELDEKTYSYDVSNFFGEDAEPITVDKATLEIGDDGNINRGRQLFAQYPPKNITDRSVIMVDFGDRLAAINQMWINVRCLDVKDFNPAVVWSVVVIVVVAVAAILLYKFRYQIFYRRPKEINENAESEQNSIN
ncbi:MAG: extracellular solute-binding protein [Roseburia sp.]|nr:extracellular solute-binding protein [Roseburia sp.]